MATRTYLSIDRPVNKNILFNLNSLAVQHYFLFNQQFSGTLAPVKTPRKCADSPFVCTQLPLKKHDLRKYAQDNNIKILRYLSSSRVFAVPLTVDLTLRGLDDVTLLVGGANKCDFLGLLGSLYFLDGNECALFHQTCVNFVFSFQRVFTKTFLFLPYIFLAASCWLLLQFIFLAAKK